MSQLVASDRLDLTRVQRGALIVAAVALIACIIGAFFDPTQFFRAYLASYVFYQGLGLGSLAILMIYHLTGGVWGYLIRRPLEAATRTLPLLALMLIPIGCFLPVLFPWARPGEVQADANLQHKSLYLNVPFWWGRAILFFLLWMGCAYFLNAWSWRQDATGDLREARRMENLSGPGLVAFGIAIHFAAVDWLMSLQPTFRSSIFGPLLASGQLVSALAFILIVASWLVTRPPVNESVSVEALNDLGNLELTFLIIWAYMAFFQFLLIWMANIRAEVGWYLDRSNGGWQWVIVAVVIFHFAVPFFCLLMRSIKRHPPALATVAGFVLFFHLVYLDWEVLPAFPGTSITQHWMDFLMPFALGGIWLAYFLWQLQRAPLLPLHDPNHEHALELRRKDLEEVAREAAMNHG